MSRLSSATRGPSNFSSLLLTGLGGVYFHRDHIRREILNDPSGRVAEWWRCVWDYGDELHRLAASTPCSKAEYERAAARLDDPELPPVDRPRLFYTLVNYEMRTSDQRPAFAPAYNPQPASWVAGNRDGCHPFPIDPSAPSLRTSTLWTAGLAGVARKTCDLRGSATRHPPHAATTPAATSTAWALPSASTFFGRTMNGCQVPQRSRLMLMTTWST